MKDDPDAPAHKCLSCWPTGPSCIILYVQAIFSFILIVTSLVAVTSYRSLGLEKDDTCSFWAILSAICAYWIRSPLTVYNRESVPG